MLQRLTMIVCRKPFRISFFGGSTDHPEWYRVHGGATLGTAINKYCYITCRFLPPFFQHRFRLVYSVIEDCQTIGDIKHPAARAVLLESHLMYTGMARTASSVAETYVPHLRDGHRERLMTAIRAMVDEGLSIRCDGRDIERFGTLLHVAWDAKRELGASVSNPTVEAIYCRARRAGAVGGKLIGAGGGGFLLLFVPPPAQARVRDELSTPIYVPFRFQFGGSEIIFADQEEDYAAQDRGRAI